MASKSNPAITIRSLDRAAIIEAITGEPPLITFNERTHLAEFQFPDTSVVRDVLIKIDQGLTCDALDLLSCRTRLYRRVKGVR